MIKHIAIIMDGNGRWAKARLMPKIMGHRQGIAAAENIIQAAKDLGVQFLTLFAFSSENWNREPTEVNDLMSLMESYLSQDVKKLIEKEVKIIFLGNREKLSQKSQDLIKEIEKLSTHFSFHLIIALSYGARDELREAARDMLEKAKQGLIQEEKLDDFISTNMLGIPDPDILIRTGGEYRISNFLLWQIAYTELFFLQKYWPDFTADDLRKVIEEFENRERRYGR